MTTHTDYIADPDDFCRSCGGRGYTIERLEQGRTLAENCRYCGGTGHKSVALKRTFAAYGGQS